jgi:hypothetical protein
LSILKIVSGCERKHSETIRGYNIFISSCRNGNSNSMYTSIILFSVVLRRLNIGVGLRVVPVQDNWTANIEFDHRRFHLNRENIMLTMVIDL